MVVESQQIFKEFKEHSVAEFFKKNRQMLGYSGPIKSLTTAVHELVTNGLDACEAAGVAPDIYVKLDKLGPDHMRLIAEDNGPGIPRKFVGKALGTMLAGTKFHKFRQSRGQQGIGGAGVVMYSQITTGKPTRIVTGTGDGKVFEAHISVDVKTNQPILADEKEYSGKMRGTRLETELKGVLYQKGEQSPDEYLRRTALANPHAKITYVDPDNLTTVYDRAVSKIPPIPKESQPHPKGLETDDILTYARTSTARTVKSFLETSFARMSAQKAKEIEAKVSFDMNKRPQDLQWNEAEEVVKAIKEMTFIAPPADCLVPVSEDHLEKALRNVLQPEFFKVITRPPAVYRGGVPFIVEVAVAYGGKSGKAINSEDPTSERMEIMRFANRTPLLFDTGGCALTKGVQSIEWKRYDIKADVPITVLVNFTSVYVPYTSAGKQAIADEEEIIKEIRLALMDSGRQVGRYVSGQRKQYEREAKKKMLLRYIEPVSEAIADLTDANLKLVEKKLLHVVETKYSEFNEEDEVENVKEGNGNGEETESREEAE